MGVSKHELNRDSFVDWGRKGGRIGGKATSEAKTRACRLNAKKRRKQKKTPILRPN